jgi:hypothetical protein
MFARLPGIRRAGVLIGQIVRLLCTIGCVLAPTEQTTEEPTTLSAVRVEVGNVVSALRLLPGIGSTGVLVGQVVRLLCTVGCVLAPTEQTTEEPTTFGAVRVEVWDVVIPLGLLAGIGRAGRHVVQERVALRLVRRHAGISRYTVKRITGVVDLAQIRPTR